MHPRAARGCITIVQSAFPVEPWCVRETQLRLDLLAQSESVFALSNGHIGLRGNLDEGEPNGIPGPYLNSFYELPPLPYPAIGYVFPGCRQRPIAEGTERQQDPAHEDPPLPASGVPAQRRAVQASRRMDDTREKEGTKQPVQPAVYHQQHAGPG